jgi:DNA-binding NarL/FixJ family response regulator
MPLRILIVDDFEPWRRFVSSALQKVDSQILLEASDGLEAVYKAEDLRPDLILLDIGLPALNGIEAARGIRDLSPNSKILFLSEENSPEVAEAALEAGGDGYVVKSDAGRELLPAVKALSQGKRYVSARLAGEVFFAAPEDHPSDGHNSHELQIYCDDEYFLDGFTSFIAGGLNAGNAVVVFATEAHRQGLVQKLQTQGFDLDTLVKSGSYTSIDAWKTLSSFMVDDRPDPDQLGSVVSSLVKKVSKAPNGATRSVIACGECAPFLWTQGKLETALRVEELWDVACHKCRLSTLCGYISEISQREEDQRIFHAICSFHSPVSLRSRPSTLSYSAAERTSSTNSPPLV